MLQRKYLTDLLKAPGPDDFNLELTEATHLDMVEQTKSDSYPDVLIPIPVG